MNYLIAFVVGVVMTLILMSGWLGVEAATVHTVYLPHVETSVQFSSIGPVVGVGDGCSDVVAE